MNPWITPFFHKCRAPDHINYILPLSDLREKNSLRTERIVACELKGYNLLNDQTDLYVYRAIM